MSFHINGAGPAELVDARSLSIIPAYVDPDGIALEMGNADGSYGPIEYGKLWNCCWGRETHVIIFDNRSRHAVCTRCANLYTGEVEPLPEEADQAPVCSLGESK